MIVKIPNPVLGKHAKKVKRIDKKILEIVDRMKNTLVSCDKPKGVGLAAPQIGISLQIFLTKPDEKTDIRVFINPEITYRSEELTEIQRPFDDKSEKSDKKLEGCLSIPNVWGYLKRAKRLRLKYMDMQGCIHEEDFEGFMATIIQHETDHLNGILFTKRVMEQKEKLYNIEENEKGEERLVEIEL